MLASVAFGALAVVAGLTISFHYDTGGGPTMAGLSVAQFFVVLLLMEIHAAIIRPKLAPLHP